MLNKQNQKRCLCFVHYFLFSSIVAAYFFCTSCGCGVREELVPVRNSTLYNLPQEGKEVYQELVNMLGDNEKEQEQLEKKVSDIKEPDALIAFINKEIQNQRNYMDLLQVLSEGQSIKLKKEIVECTNQDELTQLIASKLPRSFKQLDDDTSKSLSKLPAHQRQAILAAAMEKEGLLMVDPSNGTAASAAQQEQTDMTNEKEMAFKLDDKTTDPVISSPTLGSTTSSPGLDIKQLIDQTVKEEEKKTEDHATPQDGWGAKLPLEGEERKKFLGLVMAFKQQDQKALKELFDQAEEDSIEKFLSVYDTRFNEDERIELLATIIYLYKGWPAITVKLCNNPKSLSLFNKIGLFNKTNKKQLSLLTRLDSLLSE